jgi:hypothetical protein
MKRIALRRLPDDHLTEGSPEWEASHLDYAEMLRQCIRRPKDAQAGVDVVELRAGVRVLDALGSKKPPEVLELEDADWEHLKSKVLAMPWIMVDRRILHFVDDVLGATDVVPLNNRVDEATDMAHAHG